MSRCFPYPPPGYTRNGIGDEALIESIKLQREEEKAKKERKKVKKLEKKEKKVKEKAQENGEVESKKQSNKKRHRDEMSQADKKGDCQKIREPEHIEKSNPEHIEKSNLTEEHGQPVGAENSSDSTLNSNKKQKQITPPNARQNTGNIFRIRLPPQRHKDLEVLPGKERPCFLGRNDGASVNQIHEPATLLGREQGVHHRCSTSKSTGPELASRLIKEKPCLSLGATEDLVSQSKLSMLYNLCNSCPPLLALNFKDVVENWVPPLIRDENVDLDDQDWLFDTKQKQNENCVAKRYDVGPVGSSLGNPRPLACYLTEADVYALPFTVPF